MPRKKKEKRKWEDFSQNFISEKNRKSRNTVEADLNRYCVNEVNACQPTALNYYFKKRLFNNRKEFYNIQKAYYSKNQIGGFSDIDSDMMTNVKVGNRKYRAKIIYNNRKNKLDDFPTNVPGTTHYSGGRALMNYTTQDSEKPEFHIEPVELSEEGVYFPTTGNMNIVPFTNGMNIKEYTEKAKNNELKNKKMNDYTFQVMKEWKK